MREPADGYADHIRERIAGIISKLCSLYTTLQVQRYQGEEVVKHR
jgi:hypothetical protein